MTIDLFNHLATLDHGSLADLIKDAKVIELISEIQRGKGVGISRGKVIVDALGGAHSILTNKELRNSLFISFSAEQENIIKTALGVDDLYNLRLTKKNREKLFEIFSVQDTEQDVETQDKKAVSAVGIKYGLFEHQSVCLLKAFEYLDNNMPVMLHMPTGAGKTRTAMHLVSRHLNKIQNGIVIWLVHGIELCTQASNEFRKAWSVLGERPMPIIEMWSGKTGCKHLEVKESFQGSGRSIDIEKFDSEIWPIDLKDAAIIASVESINRLLDTWEPAERIKRTDNVRLIIFDEAHQAVATTYKRAIEMLGTKASLLGLSATPGRRHHGDVGEADEGLVDLFGGNKVSLEIQGYSSPIEALIDQGYLAKLEKEKLEIANSNLNEMEISAIRQKLSSSLDVDEGFLRIVGLDGVRTMQIVEKVKSLVGEGHKRIILFAPSIESSNLIANILKSMNVTAQSITAKTNQEDRKTFLYEYIIDSPGPYVLCNYGVLTTGFDAPKTSAVVIARPTTSIVLLSQMAGRAIRGVRVGGNKTAKMITVVDTAIPELVETINQFHAFDESWETK
jgi:superfamily II DNA or RNA helicase